MKEWIKNDMQNNGYFSVIGIAAMFFLFVVLAALLLLAAKIVTG